MSAFFSTAKVDAEGIPGLMPAILSPYCGVAEIFVVNELENPKSELKATFVAIDCGLGDVSASPKFFEFLLSLCDGLTKFPG